MLPVTARLAIAQAAEQSGMPPLHPSPKTQGGSPTATLIAAVIGFGFIIGSCLLTHLWEKGRPRAPVSPQPEAGRAAPRVPARWRPLLVAGAGLFAIPMLTFACGIIAAGFNAAQAVGVILACGLALVALDAALVALLAVAAVVAAIRARRHRSGIVAS